MVSVRLSDEEKAKLERLQGQLAEHWKLGKVEKADVIRAALAMLATELEQQQGSSR